MKRLALALSLISSAVLLSGCIIVPHRHGGYRDGHGHAHYQSGGYYPGGAVVVQPGPRR